MKYEVMLDILFTLLAKRKASASELSKKYGISVRSVYRYIDEMTVSGVPIEVARGPRGGMYISDAYKLPKGFFTREEYAKAIDAMRAMNGELGDETLSSAIDKLTAQFKSEQKDGSLSGNILVDSGTWGDEHGFTEKIDVFERAIEAREAVRIEYADRGGERTQRVILPHLLVYKQNIWYVFAYCRLREAFRLFKLGRVRAVLFTGEKFERLPFSREDIPLNFRYGADHSVDATFAVEPSALAYAQEWLGVENVRERDGGYRCDVSLPNDEALLGKILSAGSGFRVVEPAWLAARVKEEAERIAALYAGEAQ